MLDEGYNKQKNIKTKSMAIKSWFFKRVGRRANWAVAGRLIFLLLLHKVYTHTKEYIIHLIRGVPKRGHLSSVANPSLNLEKLMLLSVPKTVVPG